MTGPSRLLPVLLLSCLPLAAPAQSVPPLLPPEGVEDPTLAIGVSGLVDWSTARPFIDQMQTARFWFAAAPGDWETMKFPDLANGGYLDAEGWPIRMPPGMIVIRTIWAYADETAEERAGTYILTYEGEGSLALGGAARRLDARPGQITFQTSGKAFWLDITEIDPRGSANRSATSPSCRTSISTSTRLGSSSARNGSTVSRTPA